jgi:putative Holliday junction resolvase
LGRILAIDYGSTRTGIAVSDPLKIIANQLSTVNTKDIWEFFEEYFAKEKIELILVGYPIQTNGKGGSESLKYINPFIKKFVQKYPDIPIKQVDERYTSKIAHQMLINGGFRKKQRQDKAIVDRMSAAIMLQEYLDLKKSNNLI